MGQQCLADAQIASGFFWLMPRSRRSWLRVAANLLFFSALSALLWRMARLAALARPFRSLNSSLTCSRFSLWISICSFTPKNITTSIIYQLILFVKGYFILSTICNVSSAIAVIQEDFALKSYTVYLFRHGLTKGNLNAQYIGQTDLPLTMDSINQLHTAGQVPVPGGGRRVYLPLKAVQGQRRHSLSA